MCFSVAETNFTHPVFSYTQASCLTSLTSYIFKIISLHPTVLTLSNEKKRKPNQLFSYLFPANQISHVHLSFLSPATCPIVFCSVAKPPSVPCCFSWCSQLSYAWPVAYFHSLVLAFFPAVCLHCLVLLGAFFVWPMPGLKTGFGILLCPLVFLITLSLSGSLNFLSHWNPSFISTFFSLYFSFLNLQITLRMPLGAAASTLVSDTTGHLQRSCGVCASPGRGV